MTRLWLRLQVAREARHVDFAAALAAVQQGGATPAPTPTIRTCAAAT